MNWKGKDKKGHTHRWRKRGECYDIPSTKIIKTQNMETCYECGQRTGEMIDISTRVCRRCGEEILPGYNTVLETNQISGVQSFQGSMSLKNKPLLKLDQPFNLNKFCNAEGEAFLTCCEPSVNFVGDEQITYDYEFVIINASKLMVDENEKMTFLK